MTTTTSRYLLASAASNDSSALCRHLDQCKAAQGRMFAASAWVERAHGLVAPRFVTTVALAAMLILVSSWWL